MAKVASAVDARAMSRRAAAPGLRLAWRHPMAVRLRGAIAATLGLLLVLAFATYDPADPSFNASSSVAPANLLGRFGANASIKRQCGFPAASRSGAMLRSRSG